MKKLSELSVALVYDKATVKFGGAELVLQELSKAFPKAPLFTSVTNTNAKSWAKNLKIFNSFLQKIPLLRNHPKALTPLMPLAFELLDFSGYDVIISVTSADAKCVLTKPHQLHICYLLTPTRYLYSHKEEYLSTHPLTKLPIFRQLAQLVLHHLRRIDQVASYRPDYIIPISNLIARRSRRFYHRALEEVIYPPVPRVSSLKKNALKENEALQKLNYHLCSSRLVAYKRVDLAIKAALFLHEKLLIVGAGPEMQRLRKIAGDRGLLRDKKETLTHFLSRLGGRLIGFLGETSPDELEVLLKNANSLIMPGIEDFGISALQANLYGSPAILHHESGAAELIKDRLHGIHLFDESESSVIEALKLLKQIDFDKNRLIRNAQKYSPADFSTNFQKKVYDLFISFSTDLLERAHEAP